MATRRTGHPLYTTTDGVTIADVGSTHTGEVTDPTPLVVGGGGGNAASVTFTPQGTIAATTVEAAILEIAAEAGTGSVSAADVARTTGVGKGRVAVAARVGTQIASGISDGSVISTTYEVAHPITSDFRDLAFLDTGCYGGALMPNGYFIKRSVRIGSTFIPLGGEVYIAPGDVILSQSRVDLNFLKDTPGNRSLIVRYFLRVATLGERWPVRQLGASVDYTASGSDTTASGTMAVSAANANIYVSDAILGVPTAFGSRSPSLAIAGDSNSTGATSSNGGHIVASFGLTTAYVNTATGGALGSEWDDQNVYQSARRLRAQTCDNFMWAFGRNDAAATGVDMSATLKADYLAAAFAAQERGARGSWACTLPPSSSSTDNWATLENQTVNPFYVTTATNFGDWLRDGAPLYVTTRLHAPIGSSGSNILRAGQQTTGLIHPSAFVGAPAAPGQTWPGVFDFGDASMSSRNSGKWKVPITAATGNTTNGSPTITNAVATGGAFMVGQVLVGNGIPNNSVVTAVVGTTVTINQNATATATGVSITAPLRFTNDGVHAQPGVTNHFQILANNTLLYPPGDGTQIVQPPPSPTLDTPPAGITSGLLAWHRADSSGVSYVNDDPVTTLDDRTTNGRVLTSTSTARPLFKTNVFGTKPGILFDGVNDYLMYLAGAAFHTGTQFTAVLVLKRVSGGGGVMAAVGNGQANGNVSRAGFEIDQNPPGGDTARIITGNQAEQQLASMPATGTAYILSVRFDGTNTSLKLNNNAVATDALAGTTAFTIDRLVLGARFASSVPATFGNYYLGAALFYGEARTNGELSSIVTELASTYSVTL